VSSDAPLRLTEWTSCGGCAAKWGASLLRDLVGGFAAPDDPGLLVGLAPFDDAAVYRVSDDVAIVSTTDFVPPLVDDPSDFGAIAAANACSDVFAMGGRVVMALNVAAFPEHFPREAIAAILASAAEVVRGAGGSVAGGHTIRNPEPVFGLAVQGIVHPDRILRKGGARPGDAVLISKPLGTALVLAGGTDGEKAAAIAGMRATNRAGLEMAERSGAVLVLDGAALPAYAGAREAAARDVRTGGDPRNRQYVDGRFVAVDEVATALCMDPQTSGGLLAAVDEAAAADLVVGGGWWRIGGFVAGDVRVEIR
jgi:selenide,water dikinase